MLESSPQPADSLDTTGAPAPSSIRPNSLKKRRVTISGAPHPLDTNVRIPPSEPTSSTPISPVVIGFTIQRDDPAALEQVRSMLTVKQKQKQLIEQRRGSAAGILSSTGGTGTANEERGVATKSPAAPRIARRSPNPAGNSNNNGRRLPNTPGQVGNTTARPPSPNPTIVSSQQTIQVQNQVPAGMAKNLLQAPPISFARRRAGQLGGGKKKPADIVISPREAHTQEQFQPAIQSAPPIPQAGQGQFYTGRFPMTLPRLPSVMAGNEGIRRPIAGQVPPTPTRLAMQRSQTGTGHQGPSSLGVPTRSPPASVAIATTLVPPTPASLHRPGYAGDKSAFLAPFGLFYDALNDSKQLKSWLGEQLQKSNQLVQQLTQQQERLDEVVDSMVERKLSGVRNEVVGLHRRVEELEEALRITQAELVRRRQSDDGSSGFQTMGRHPIRNGAADVAHETYTFPPVTERRRTDPIVKQSTTDGRFDKEREGHILSRSENASPVPYNSRRLSVSAIRLDPPRLPPESSSSSSSQLHNILAAPSPRPRLCSPRAKSASLNSTPVLASRSHHEPHATPHRQLTNPRPRMSSPTADRPGSPMDDDDG